MNLIILVFLIPFSVFCASIQFNFTDEIPVDLRISLSHIEEDKNISEEQINKLKDDIEKINTAYKNLSKTNFLFTLKSTLYSSILDYKNNDYQQITVKTSDFSIIQTKINEQTSLYSKLSVWIFEQIQDDFKEYMLNDYLNNFETAPVTQLNSIKKKELQRLLTIYSPLIRIYKTYDATKLKAFNTQLTLFAISQVASKYPYFSYANIKSDSNLQLISYKIAKDTPKEATIQPAEDSKSKKDKTLEALKEIEPKNQQEALDELNEL